MTSAAASLPTISQAEATAASVKIAHVIVNGSTFALPPHGVTAFVGGNNVGKSTILREILNQVSIEPGMPEPTGKVLDAVKVSLTGTAEDAVQWMRQHYPLTVQPSGIEGFVNPGQPALIVPPQSVSAYWGETGRLGVLASYMIHYSEPLTRAQVVQGTQIRASIDDPAAHPFHKLQDDPDLLDAVSNICVDLFRKPLTLDRLSLTTVLRVGAVSIPAPPIDRVTREYRDAVASLPPLSEQGEGMKSLLGLLLPVITSTYQVVVIDEPEAFLHPPQAFELGKLLAQIAARRKVQILASTHDRNFLAGLLAGASPVTIIRLERRADVTTAAQLAPDDVSRLWTDPVLRYSNVLDGIFHRAVVVAEADPDCRFYSAALDGMDADDKISIPPSEVHFVPAGGKDGMAKIVRALRAVRVLVVASPDLDILDNPEKLKRLVEAYEGEWEDFLGEYRTATAELMATPTEATCGDVLALLNSHLGPIQDNAWTNEVRQSLRPILRTAESKLRRLKRYGMQAFSGQSAVAAESLLTRLEALGICPVRAGELERLAPTLGVSKGPTWLSAALESGAHRRPETVDHMARVLKAAGVS